MSNIIKTVETYLSNQRTEEQLTGTKVTENKNALDVFIRGLTASALNENLPFPVTGIAPVKFIDLNDQEEVEVSVSGNTRAIFIQMINATSIDVSQESDFSTSFEVLEGSSINLNGVKLPHDSRLYFRARENKASFQVLQFLI